MSKATTTNHQGFKYLHLILALVLGTFWGLLNFFGWLTGVVTLTTFAYGMVGVTLYLLFAFIWQILWTYFTKASKLISGVETDLNFKYVFLMLTLILGFAWTLFSFFGWVAAMPAIDFVAALTTYAYGIVGVTLFLLFAFIWEVLWSFFHKASEM